MTEASISNMDFYERKIRKLEECNYDLLEELSILRNRLRIAEDFEIKYTILLKNSERQKETIKQYYENREKTIFPQQIASKIKQNDASWQNKLKQLQSQLRQESQHQVAKVNNQLQLKRLQISSLKQRGQQIQIFSFKLKKFQRENESLKEQIQQMRQIYQKQRTDQISKIKSTLNTTNRQKLQAQRKKYEYKIIQLQTKLTQIQIQKDNDYYKPSTTTNKQLLTIKKLLQQNLQTLNTQIQQQNKTIIIKNNEIKRLLNQKYQFQLKYRKQINQLKQYTKQLQQKIVQIQKQHHLEIFNLTIRNNFVKDQENKELKEEIVKVNQELNKRNQLWNQKIQYYQNQINENNNKFQQDRRKNQQQKTQYKKKIAQLNKKITDMQHERESGGTNNLINSLKQIDSKQDNYFNYENGIVFLERQLKSCQIKLQQKSRNINKLYEDINKIRNEADSEVNELKDKLKNDRLTYGEKIFTLETQIKDLNDKMRILMKDQKRKQRGAYQQIKQYEEQIKSLKQFIDELQRDYNRVLQGKKDLQTSYRSQKQKGFTQKTDNQLLKKAKWLQLQKQKNELMIIFRQKQQQLKLAFENEIDEINNKYTKLKQEHQILLTDYQIVKKNYQLLQAQNKENRDNRKMVQYNKKMLSLNLQLALTQNIYQSLVKAKSNDFSFQENDKVQRIQLPSNSSQADLQELSLTFNPAKNRNR